MSENPELQDTLEALETLLKADGGEGGDGDESNEDSEPEDDGDEYDASYMKKHMKRFMKDEESYMKKYMKDMHKAFSDAIPDPDILESHEATLIDGTEFFKAFAELGNGLLKAVGEINARVQTLEKSVAQSESLTKASAAVVADIRRQQARIVSNPVGAPRAVAGVESMQKAEPVGVRVRKELLIKATTGTEDERARASSVLARFEIANYDVSRLPPADQNYVKTIAAALV